jgi:4-hydroxybenzoate polyprenyltransferase
MGRFCTMVYAPGLHVAYAAFWLLALEGALVLTHPEIDTWKLDLRLLGAIASNFLVLFFLRVVDELKDYEYDKVHNPERPLVTGLVSRRELVAALALTAVVVLVLNAALAWVLVVIAAADMVYALALIALERRSPRVRDGMFLNLAVTYPVNIALSIYIYAFFLERYGVTEVTVEHLLVLAAFTVAFLHYEVGRKTAWPQFAPAGERLYSQVLGGWGAGMLAAGCAVGAAAAMLAALAPWRMAGFAGALAWVLIIPALLGLWGLARLWAAGAAGSGKKPMKLSATAFLFGFYLSITALALVGNALHFG